MPHKRSTLNMRAMRVVVRRNFQTAVITNGGTRALITKEIRQYVI